MLGYYFLEESFTAMLEHGQALASPRGAGLSQPTAALPGTLTLRPLANLCSLRAITAKTYA